MDTETLYRAFKRHGLNGRSVQAMLGAIKKLPPEQRGQYCELLDRFEESQRIHECRDSFMPFVRRMWPGFIEGRHHNIIADAFDRIVSGKLKRLIINIAPRHTKSQFTSWLLPAWFLGKFPDKKIIQCAHTADLAVGFGRQVRNLVDSAEYQNVFPDIKLAKDSKAAGRWNTNHGGEYFAIGVGGAVTGKGADLCIVDDPHSEQEATMAVGNPQIYDKVYDWYMSGPRQRLQPGGAIALIMTRWSRRDLTAKLIQDMQHREADEWEVIELPAILPSGNPLWPEFWPLEELLKTKETLNPPSKWNAQYMQNPTSDDAAIVKREWWNRWEQDDPPQCEYIIQSWDTAMSKSERANYSACTTWGVFYRMNEEGRSLSNVILLDAYQEKLEFPNLKQMAFELYNRWKPDSLIVERKNSGEGLIHEFRQRGVPVQEFNPQKGLDKFTRLTSVADLFGTIIVQKDDRGREYYIRKGIVWAPMRKWADEVIDQVASFPSGENDDLVDSMTAALIRFRRGGFIRLESDEPEPDRESSVKRRTDYY